MAARAEDWNHQSLAEPWEELTFKRGFSPAELEKLTQGLVPRGPQDKWFVFHEHSWLFFHRSRSGECVFEVRLGPRGAVEARVGRLDGFTPEDQRALLDFLIDRLLLGLPVGPPELAALSKLDQPRRRGAWENLVGKLHLPEV